MSPTTCYYCHRPTHPRELVGIRRRKCLRCVEREHERVLVRDEQD